MSEIIAPSGRSITDVAAEMGVSRQALCTVLNGHASLSADTLMRLQTSYDLAQARLQLAG